MGRSPEQIPGGGALSYEQDVAEIRKDPGLCECMSHTPPDIKISFRCHPCREAFLLDCYGDIQKKLELANFIIESMIENVRTKERLGDIPGQAMRLIIERDLQAISEWTSVPKEEEEP